MSDEHVSQEPARSASASTAQKPKYEAPAIVNLCSPGKGAGYGCVDGSGDSVCLDGSAASDCGIGSGGAM